MRLYSQLILTALCLPKAAAFYLIRPGVRLAVVASDDSELTNGGTLEDLSSFGDCASKKFRELCDDHPPSATKLGHHVFDGDTVTTCGRSRTERSCYSCTTWGSEQRCDTRFSESYAGSRTTYELVQSPGDVAVLSVSDDLGITPCSNVCLNSDGQAVFPKNDQSSCLVQDGWYLVDGDFQEECPVQEVCEELEIVAGCEDTEMDYVLGRYRPVADAADICDENDVTLTRTVYVRDNGDNSIYLFHDTSDTWYIRSSSSSTCGHGPYRDTLFTARFDAGDEPFKDVDDEIRCYNGGWGNYLRTKSTPLEIRCNRLTSQNSANGSSTSSASLASLNVVTLMLLAGITLMIHHLVS